MILKDYYISLTENSKEIITQSLGSENLNFYKCHASLEDLGYWKNILNSRYEKELYSFAINEYQRSLYLALQGSYRHAFMALRFFIEHSCAAIYFSSREIEFRMWTKGKLDISWSKLLDLDLGVFSKQTIDLYFSELVEYAHEFQELAKSLYRNCSEYTHGNYVTYNSLNLELSYNDKVFKKFIELAQESIKLITFLFTSRFYKEINIHVC